MTKSEMDLAGGGPSAAMLEYYVQSGDDGQDRARAARTAVWVFPMRSSPTDNPGALRETARDPHVTLSSCLRRW